MAISDVWARFVDDASPLPDGPLEPRTSPWVGDRLVRDDSLPRLRGYDGDLRVVLSGGAAQVSGPAAFCADHDLELSSLDTTLRELADPAGNARRVVAAVRAAVDAGTIHDDTHVHVRCPGGALTPAWLVAAEVIAEAEMTLCLPLEAGDPEPWIDAAMDRELGVSLVGGTVDQAVAAVAASARLWGHPDDLAQGRRWVRCWAATDVDAALVHLAGLFGA